MAETLQRSPGTISRDGHYGNVVAHHRCQTRPLGKLHPSTVTFDTAG